MSDWSSDVCSSDLLSPQCINLRWGARSVAAHSSLLRSGSQAIRRSPAASIKEEGMVKGLLIPADGKQPIEQQEYESLEDYQRAVGGWIEAVDIHELLVTLYVNETGIAKRWEPNRRAKFLLWSLGPHTRWDANR